MIPAVIGFLCMMSMMGKGMQEKMAEYQNALEAMSSEATEYVRGIPVVKTFGQTVNSFKKFKSMIDNFGRWATDYTLMLRGPMIGFMTCINAIFLSFGFIHKRKIPKHNKQENNLKEFIYLFKRIRHPCLNSPISTFGHVPFRRRHYIK
jgi:ABC-type multidrug transport system fused ATPase/permease subunit